MEELLFTSQGSPTASHFHSVAGPNRFCSFLPFLGNPAKATGFSAGLPGYGPDR